MIRLRHPNRYETYYLHLSAIARGIRPQLTERIDAADSFAGVLAMKTATDEPVNLRR